MLIPIELFGEPWVLFRDEHGQPACVKDECAHRACPLSLGSVVDGHVQCPYHGWEYNAEGECTKMPSTVQCSGITVTSLPTMERDGAHIPTWHTLPSIARSQWARLYYQHN